MLKLAGSEEPATAPSPIDDEPPVDAGSSEPQPSSDDKPFDDEPFDAGVEADEESDPKKFIEQLTGKLGQSLRKYNENQGQPDFELEKFAINSLLSATHTSQMDQNDQDDIIKKVKTAGNNNDSATDSQDDSNDDNNDSTDFGDDSGNGFSSDLDGGSDDEVVDELQEGNVSVFLDKPKKNNMFQPGSNDVLKEACWKGYKQVGMKEKDGKEVPNCVPINENNDGGESQNYMFWQNLKTIHHASGELLGMDQAKVDAMIANGHAWAVDHIATSSDDIEEVYHFLEANLEYNGDTESGYSDEYGSVEGVQVHEGENDGKPLNKPMKGDVKKFKVYVKNSKGNVVKVNFGDPNMEIKRDDPERRKSFRARHKCSQAHDKTTPKYWSCKMWSKTPVSKMVSEDLNMSEKNSIFVKIKSKLRETFNQEETMSEPMIEPQVQPVVKPSPDKVQPNIAPSRKNKPFLPMPDVKPDPKAIKEGKFDFETYHKTLSATLDEVRNYVIRRGFDPIEFDINDIQHVGYGQTERFNKELTKNGKPLRNSINVQIYRMDSGNYELNMYIA